MKYISLFSGIECASVAARPLGWEPICFSEIEPFPSAVLAHHYPDVPNVGDMTAHDWSRYRGRCDVVVGGSPCQAFSVAGRRESLDDARGNLTFAFVEAVNAIDPAFIVWENVPGILSTKDNAFGSFLGALAGCAVPIIPPRGRKWSSAGVVDGSRRSLAWRVLDAQFFGVPQRRRRVFLVARRAGERPHPAEILFELDGVRGDSAPRGEAGKDSAAGVGGGTEGRGEQREVTGAVSAKWEKGTGGPAGDECQNLVAALTTRGYADNDGQESRIVVGALTARGDDGMRLGNSFDLQGGLQVAHTLRGDGFDASEDGTGRGTPLATAFHGSQDPDVSGSVTHPVSRNQGQETCVMASGVRRLTPRECERLQGLPDDYTLVPYRGKPAADGPRYKAIGNGMAVPCVRWIFERINSAMRAQPISKEKS